MATKIFVNLPVKDLNKSVEFFTQVGFEFNKQFTDKNATCMIVSEDIYVMLLVEPFFKSFTKRDIADTSRANEVIVCLSVESREVVDAVVEKAIAAGAGTVNPPQDHGYMYDRDFVDPDGHLWNYVWMNPSAVQPEPADANTETV